MAEVWRGKAFGADGTDRILAIKRILPNIAEDEEFITMFIDEAKISVQLTHDNICQLHDLGNIGGSYFIAMEYIPGKDLRAIFDKCKKSNELPPVPLVCHAVARMSAGLDHAHRKKDLQGNDLNIVHRDISPQNCLVSYDGLVKVIDFGIAKAANKASRTQAGILKGKFGYMAPEQILGGDIDRRADVFAIGVVLWEMLTTQRLFVGDSDFAVLEKVRKADVPPPSKHNPHVPPELDRIALKALARDLNNRYQYASELERDLEAFLSSTGSVFGTKEMAAFMKATFAEEVERERLRTVEYAAIKAPEAAGRTPAGRAPTGSMPAVRPG
ncbi:MAG: serine/threonine protein kinase, partial [Deltaproteobacteria bacterium]|nr:serine/threonine protein kinase [Deltaproteobacteria bacterium]